MAVATDWDENALYIRAFISRIIYVRYLCSTYLTIWYFIFARGLGSYTQMKRVFSASSYLTRVYYAVTARKFSSFPHAININALECARFKKLPFKRCSTLALIDNNEQRRQTSTNSRIYDCIRTNNTCISLWTSCDVINT